MEEDDQCPRCHGSGYDSAARCMGMLDYPRSMQPLGVFTCGACGGTGKVFKMPELIWTEEEKEELRNMLKKLREESK